MSILLLEKTETDLPVEAFLAEACDFPPVELKKENTTTRAWFARSEETEYFLKWVETARYEELLAKEAAICSRCLHPVIVTLHGTVRTADGVLLVFEKMEGETLQGPVLRARFFRLPVEEKISALRTIFDALAAIVEDGWILVDFYEGNVMYDFASRTVRLFDFDVFEQGDGYVLQMDRNYGSRRLMAPEEFVRGAWLDQTTNTYTLARYVINALCTNIDDWRDEMSRQPGLARVIERGVQLDRSKRFSTVRAFVEAFRQAVEILFITPC